MAVGWTLGVVVVVFVVVVGFVAASEKLSHRELEVELQRSIIFRVIQRVI